MPCPHPYGLKVPSPNGECYACLKIAATNGHRDRLSPEALAFVGFATDTVATNAVATTAPRWLQPTNPSTIDRQIEELERLRDLAPGWYALARRILEDEGTKS